MNVCNFSLWYNGAPAYSVGQDSSISAWYLGAMGQYNRKKTGKNVCKIYGICRIFSGSRRRVSIF